MNEYGLGRKPEFDERSRHFPVTAILEAKRPRSYTWAGGPVLDQGAEGACVGFAWAGELAARPVVVKGITDQTGRAFYRRAQQVDEWEGEEPAYSGTSVLAGAKAVMEAGHLKEYRWAFGVDDLALAVGYTGPAVIGIDWHSSMYTPDADGFIHPRGNIVGGHAIIVRGYSVKLRRFVLRNSWGAGWGRGGDGYISYDDLGGLLASRGDACVPVKRR